MNDFSDIATLFEDTGEPIRCVFKGGDGGSNDPKILAFPERGGGSSAPCQDFLGDLSTMH